MAKKIGQVNEGTGRVESRKVARSREVEFPVTHVTTRAQRIKRALIG
jgi:hypothetical protein